MPNPSDIMAGHAAALEGLNQGQPQPQGPPGPDRGALRKIWDAIEDPRVQMWMLSAGNRLLNPKRGESQFARFGNAITQGYEGLGASMIMQQERARRAGLEERGMQVEEARAGQGQQRVEQLGRTGEAQITRGEAMTDLGQEQLKEETRHRKAVDDTTRRGQDISSQDAQGRLGVAQGQLDESVRHNGVLEGLSRDAESRLKAGQLDESEYQKIMAETARSRVGLEVQRVVLEKQRVIATMKGADSWMHQLALRQAQETMEYDYMSDNPATTPQEVRNRMEQAYLQNLNMLRREQGGGEGAGAPAAPKVQTPQEAGAGKPGETRMLLHPETGQPQQAQWAQGTDPKSGKPVWGWKFLTSGSQREEEPIRESPAAEEKPSRRAPWSGSVPTPIPGLNINVKR